MDRTRNIRGTSGNGRVGSLFSTAGLFAWVILLLAIVAVSGRKLRQEEPGSNFVGEGSNELATALLQGFVNEENNFVFSPLGYSAILAILSEGARGETRNQLISALHLPEDTYSVRQTYKAVLEKMMEKETLNKPEFRNWFYVYKNVTVEEDYKRVLLENYLTQVKAIDRIDDYIYDSENEPPQMEKTDGANKEAQERKGEAGGRVTVTTASSNNDKNERKGNVASLKEVGRSFEKAFLSALSANRLSVNEENYGANILSKMIVFNGLYFKGTWAIPFTMDTNATEENSFYISEQIKKPVETMQTQGVFETGAIPVLDCSAIELPYEGSRYSLLVLLPNSRDGLPKLISDLTNYSLRNVFKHLTKRTIEVCLPKFDFQTTSKPKEVLMKYGVSTIFSKEADLSGISPDDGLYLDELVQLVTVEIDEGSSQTNYLTSSNVATRSGLDKFFIDHPFLFFIRDRIDNIIIATGKVIDPSKKSGLE